MACLLGRQNWQIERASHRYCSAGSVKESRKVAAPAWARPPLYLFLCSTPSCVIDMHSWTLQLYNACEFRVHRCAAPKCWRKSHIPGDGWQGRVGGAILIAHCRAAVSPAGQLFRTSAAGSGAVWGARGGSSKGWQADWSSRCLACWLGRLASSWLAVMLATSANKQRPAPAEEGPSSPVTRERIDPPLAHGRLSFAHMGGGLSSAGHARTRERLPLESCPFLFTHGGPVLFWPGPRPPSTVVRACAYVHTSL